jgi:F-type H+-transporting ATPase subunit b
MFDLSSYRAVARRASALAVTLTLAATPLLAQQHGAAAGEPVNLLQPRAGLMVWTVLIFFALMVLLSRYAFKPLYAAVEAREKALEEAIEGAKRDRADAARFLAQQKEQLDAARAEAQKIIAESRVTGEKLRADMVEQTKMQQHDMIEQARRTIEGERDAAIAQMRRETIDLAIAGASRVIEQNLDSDANRRIVESYLASIGSQATR